MSVFHVKAPVPKHVENSVRGIKRAKRLDYDEIDLDMLITKDGRIVGCHWPRPMLKDGFRDPYGVIDPHSTVASLKFSEVHRLRARTGLWTYRIQPIELLLHQCAKSGVGAVLEPKGDPRFKNKAVWDHLMKVAEDCGADVRVYALPQNAAALPYAKAASFRVKEI